MVDDTTKPLNTPIKENGVKENQDQDLDSFSKLMEAISQTPDKEQYFFDSLGLFYQRDLGRGGDSLVSLATKSDGTSVAIKRSINSFHNEAANMNLIRREGARVPAHVPALYQEGRYPNNVSYLMMEYISAEPLIAGKIDLNTVLQIGIDVAKTLYVAHRHGISHYDVKPENILLSDGNAYLIDWGASVLRGSQTAADQENLVCTLSYTAPERFDNDDLDELSGFADQFSLGATLYTFITGNKPYNAPFKGTITEEERAAEYNRLVTAQEKPRLSSLQQPLHESETHRLDAVDNLITKMLHPEPLGRYSSCIEVAYLLTQIKQGK